MFSNEVHDQTVLNLGNGLCWQLEMQVFTPSAGFDEGADPVEWQSWGKVSGR